MLLPALNAARDKAKAISCTNNLKTLGSALNMYTLNYNDFLIPNYNILGEAPNSGIKYAYWIGILCELPYGTPADPPKDLCFRRSSNYGVMWGRDSVPHPPKGEFSCPAAEFGVQGGVANNSGNSAFSHYLLNHTLHGGSGADNSSYWRPFYKISRINVPSKAISLAERGNKAWYSSWTCFYDYETSIYLNYDRHDSKSGKGRANVLYSDGHVGSLTQAAAAAIKKNPSGNDNKLFLVGYQN